MIRVQKIKLFMKQYYNYAKVLLKIYFRYLSSVKVKYINYIFCIIDITNTPVSIIYNVSRLGVL